MIIKARAEPSRLHKGEYIVMGLPDINVEDCEQIHVDTGDSVVTYVRAPIPSADVSCCYGCHLSSKHPGRIRGICANVIGCVMHQMHYIEATELLEEL